MIPGGYILQPRCFDGSDASKFPPNTREIWHFLLRNVNHSNNGKILKGQKIFSYSDIQEGLHWYSGYRKMMYSKPQIAKALRRLSGGSMVETTAATGGILITICNYEYYQDPKNYGGNTGGNAEAMRRQCGGNALINKGIKNEEERRKNKTPISPLEKHLETMIEENSHQNIKDQIIVFFKYRQAKPKAKQYQTEKGINGLFRDLAGCRESGLNLFDCLEIAMENNWQTVKPEYFKTNGANNGTAKHNYTGADNRPPVLGDRDLVI